MALAPTPLSKPFFSTKPISVLSLSSVPAPSSISAVIEVHQAFDSALLRRRSSSGVSKVAKECKVKSVKARQITDGGGNPTVEVDLMTDDLYRSATPSGAPPELIYEVLELRDGDKGVFLFFRVLPEPSPAAMRVAICVGGF